MSLKADNQDLEFLLRKKRKPESGPNSSIEPATHEDLSFLLDRPGQARAPRQSAEEQGLAEGAADSDDLFFDFDINDEVVDLAEELRLSRGEASAGAPPLPDIESDYEDDAFALETDAQNLTAAAARAATDAADPLADVVADIEQSAVGAADLSEPEPQDEIAPESQDSAASHLFPEETSDAEGGPRLAERDFSLEEVARSASSSASLAERGRDAEHAAIVEALTSEVAEKETLAKAAPDGMSRTVFGEFLKETQGKKGAPGAEPKISGKRDSGDGSRLSESRPGLDFATLFANSSFLGLDLGASTIKHVLLRKSATGIRLLSAGAYKSPAPGWQASASEGKSELARALREKLQPGQVKNALVSTAVSGMEVVFKNVAMPPMSRKDLRRAVPWACRKDFPFPVESTIFEFTTFADAKAKDGGKTPVFVVGALKELVEKHVRSLNAAGIFPSKVSTIPAALLRTFRLCAHKEMLNHSYAIIDIGAESSHIVFINKGRLQFARQISTSGGEFTEALTGDIFIDGKEIHLSESEAEGLKRRYGVPSDSDESIIAGGIALREVAVMLGPIVERLASELQRTAEFCKEKFKVAELSGIFLTGGGALMPNLATKLEGQLSLPVRNLNPFDAILLNKHRRADELYGMGPRFAVAVGLALDTGRELNLLPESLRGAHLFQYLKRVLRYVVVMAALVMLLLSQATSRQVSHIERSLNVLRKQYQEEAPKREKYIRLRRRKQALLDQRKQYEQVIDVDLEAAEHLRAISHFILPHMTLTSLRIERRELTGKKKGDAPVVKKVMILDGVAFETDSMEGMNLARFLMRMEKSNYFAAVSLRSQSTRKDGSLQFTIECDL